MPDVVSEKSFLPAGGGAYSLPLLTLGIFLNDQPSHRISQGSDRALHSPLKKHQGWLLPAGSEGVCEYDDDLEFVTVTLNDSLLDEFGVSAGTGFEAIIGEIDPVLLSISLNALNFADGGHLYRETMSRALAAQVVQLIKPAPSWQAGIEDRRLRKVLEYIHDNLADDLTLAAMADLAAMSGTHFSKAFKKEVGVSPLQYVIGARLDLASVLLRTTRDSVSQITWRVGYHDISRFSQHFKRKFGMTPAAYRDR
ncbi:MAG: AraC family transcriptional regulator [Pseudomonadota bacterium]